MMSHHQSQQRAQPGRTCCMHKEKGKSAQVVIIDIDQSDCSNVDFVDVPESSHKKGRVFSRLRTNRKGFAWNVISIDDENGCDLDSDITSSRKHYANEKNNHCFTEESDDEDCQIFYERRNLPFKLSKFSHQFSGKVHPRNHFDLFTDSEVRPSESDNSDCEVMEGSMGKIREQWEKAASRKKSLEDQISTSEPCTNPQKPQHRKSCKIFDTDNNGSCSYSETSVQSNCCDGMDNQVNHNFSVDSLFFQHDDVTVKGSGQFVNQDCHQDKNDLVSEAQLASRAQAGYETEFDHEYSSFTNRGKSGQEKHVTVQDEGLDHLGHTKVVIEGPCSEEGLVSGTEMDPKRAIFEEKEDCWEDHFVNTDRDEVIKNNKELARGEFFHREDGTPEEGSEQKFLISDRERLKETEEYKRAQDEEWRARRQQLQIQAEEAKQLRKRKKAEILRLLDMERRQKQRVEEIRESQKKDEETINLKEQLRVEVRKKLEVLELKYGDMASLLRALGIHVEGGLHPTLHEIRAAYKQALLRYHPDRSSTASIGQQVEAEETFKLISHLKEKLLPTA
ncbi:stress response protein NST1-like [Aristolochia californica]|uniref:stress response protein NST1-like n=1 Tax=Aristolochia californica TaxID=171875 RepID=UPI0035DDA271